MQLDWLFIMAMFALSGALTNWIAVHMLFEKVPGLYGSGIIQIKFAEFKAGIKSLMMEQFFTQENLDKFLTEQDGQAHHFDLKPIIEDTDMTPAYDSLVATIQQSSFGGMLNMFGGVEALEPLKQPFIDKLKSSVIEITESDEFAEKLKANVGSEQNVSSMLNKVDNIVTQRLEELTPQMVKDIIQEMIKSHLGWLVVWGGLFGGLIGLVAHLVGL
jgi:uncharacterized membrane protein YheB (UPF0754 family)